MGRGRFLKDGLTHPVIFLGSSVASPFLSSSSSSFLSRPGQLLIIITTELPPRDTLERLVVPPCTSGVSLAREDQVFFCRPLSS